MSTPAQNPPPAGTSPLSTEALSSSLTQFRTGLQTPESLGWAIVNYVLSEGVTQGTITGNRIEVPLTATVTLPDPATESGTDVVSEFCITVLGHSLACIQYHIHQETHTS